EAFRLRHELTHLGLLQGFDELLCLPTLRGVETYWYQLETVRKALKQFRGRALLADEVGLGKTIGAGMVLKEYLLRGMAELASLESDWLEKFGRLLDERGRRLKFAASAAVPPLGHVERIVERNVVLQNAVYRLSRVEQAWTRYLIFIFRYTAISDEKREGIIKFGINLINGSAIDPMVDQLLATAMERLHEYFGGLREESWRKLKR